MQELTEDIASGRFADEWDAESAKGHPTLARLREEFAGAGMEAMERELRKVLGPDADAG